MFPVRGYFMPRLGKRERAAIRRERLFRENTGGRYRKAVAKRGRLSGPEKASQQAVCDCGAVCAKVAQPTVMVITPEGNLERQRAAKSDRRWKAYHQAIKRVHRTRRDGTRAVLPCEVTLREAVEGIKGE